MLSLAKLPISDVYAYVRFTDLASLDDLISSDVVSKLSDNDKKSLCIWVDEDPESIHLRLSHIFAKRAEALTMRALYHSMIPQKDLNDLYNSAAQELIDMWRNDHNV